MRAPRSVEQQWTAAELRAVQALVTEVDRWLGQMFVQPAAAAALLSADVDNDSVWDELAHWACLSWTPTARVRAEVVAEFFRRGSETPAEFAATVKGEG